jgi:hypothetical protein
MKKGTDSFPSINHCRCKCKGNTGYQPNINHGNFNSFLFIAKTNFVPMLRYLFFAFLIYLAYRLVFHFIIPIYKTTRQVKKQFREMHSRMQDNMSQQQPYQQPVTPATENKKQQAGDYIDFEELK